MQFSRQFQYTLHLAFQFLRVLMRHFELNYSCLLLLFIFSILGSVIYAYEEDSNIEGNRNYY